MSRESHIERTAKEPRDASLHKTTIIQVDEINPSIRIIRLGIPGPEIVTFLPGQWLDVYLPSVLKPGGFTITSPPSRAVPPSPPSLDHDQDHDHDQDRQHDHGNLIRNDHDHSHDQENKSKPPYLELAIQKSPSNPAAAYLWQPGPSILHTPVTVRVGGTFVWPPPGITPSSETLRRAIFVAGGVGVNPLMSMLSLLAESSTQPTPWLKPETHFLYSVRDPGFPRDPKGILFLERIAGIFTREQVTGDFRLFLTPGGHVNVNDINRTEGRDGTKEGDDLISCNGIKVPFVKRRVSVEDIAEILGDDKDSAVVYVCGVPTMTDEFVDALINKLGMEPRRVLFEKWW